MRGALLLAVLGFSCGSLNAGVSLDPGFSDDGRQTGAFDLDSIKADAARRVFRAADGGYWLAGSASDNGVLDLAVLKLDANGALDTSYDGDGRATIDSPFSRLVDVAIDVNGNLIFAGLIDTVSGSDIGLMRVKPDANLDSGFASFGLYQFDNADLDEPLALAATPAGHIVLAARVRNADTNWIAYAIAVRNDGLDDDFQNLGIVAGGEGGAALYSALRGGALLAWPRVNNPFCQVLVELAGLSLPGGAISLSTSGVASTSLAGDCSDISLTALAEAPDNSLALAGSIDNASFPGAAGHRLGLLLRFRPDGLPDASFDGDGVLQVAAPFPQSGLMFAGVDFDAGNALVAAGSTSSADASLRQFVLTRRLSNGAADAAFSTDGAFTGTTFSAASGQSTQNIGRSLLVDGERILLAGSRLFSGSDSDFAIAAWADHSTFADGFESP